MGSIKRKAGAPVPTRPLLIIFDYFTSGSGNFFTVDSYSGMEWENIPTYIPNITDPAGMEPDGVIELTDAVDFRSYVGRLCDPSSALDLTGTPVDISSIALQPLLHGNEMFYTKTGVAAPLVFDLPKSGQAMTTSAMSHYLPRIDNISIS